MARGPKDLTPEDRRIWARVTGSVTPPKSRKAARVMLDMAVPVEPLATIGSAKPTRTVRPGPKPSPGTMRPMPGPSPRSAPTATRSVPEELEPRRQRRLSRERDPIEGTIDLHGFGRFEAEDQLSAFLTRAQARNQRAVLVITGQGRRGGGVIRASVHEWLQSPALRGIVSGFASAARRHGGDGAIYVTLKRRS